jgi:hypothetical protein
MTNDINGDVIATVPGALTASGAPSFVRANDDEHPAQKRLDHSFGAHLADPERAPPDVAEARRRLNACKHYCDLALIELPEDPAGQDLGAAAEQARDARDQLDVALTTLAGAAG